MAKHLSGTMRFSVESLLYYAPKIVQTGDTLAASVTTVRRQLLDLGDFVGTSWMEESFRTHYLPAEQAMLVSAAGLAYEIQAIGAGIEQMARTYGITEQQNSADVNRIRQNQDQYPADKLPQPLPARHEEPPPSPLVPTPKPGKSPHPVAPSPSPSTSGPTATPTPYTGTPMPRPGLAPTDHYTTDGGRTILGPWWPNTNTTRMEDAAHAWTLLTGALDNAWTDLRRYTAYIMADTQGPAADAFNEYVDGLTARGHGSLTQAVQVSEDLHDFCLAQVREVVNTRSMILQTVIDLGLQIALDQALAAVSDGAGEVLTSGAIARFITRAVDILEELLSFGGKGAEVLEDAGKLFAKAVGSKAGKIGTKALAEGGKGALIGVANTFINNEIDKAFGAKPESVGQALQDAKGNFAGSFITSLITDGAGAASTKAFNLGTALANNGDKAGAEELYRLSRHLEGLAPKAVNAYISNAVASGQLTVSPSQLLSGTIASKISSSLEKS